MEVDKDIDYTSLSWSGTLPYECVVSFVKHSCTHANMTYIAPLKFFCNVYTQDRAAKIGEDPFTEHP